MAKLADLIVEVSSKGVTQVRQGLETIDQVGKKVSQTVSLIQTAIMGFGGYQIINSIKSCVKMFEDYTEKIDAANKMTGISTDRLQKLKYAADQEAASFEQIMNSMKFLTRAQTEAIMGSEEMTAWFKAMEVEIKNTDGSMRKTEDVFYDLIDAINSMDNEAEQAAAALKFFGRSGNEILPFIKLGSPGIKEMGDRLERLGGVMSEDMIKKGESFGDTMKQLNTQFEFVKMTVADALIPTMYELAAVLGELSSHKDIIYALVDMAKMGGLPSPAGIIGGKMDREMINAYIKAQQEHKKLLLDLTRITSDYSDVGTKAATQTRDIHLPVIDKMTEAEKEELRITQQLAKYKMGVEIPVIEHEIDSRDRLEKLRANFLIQEAQLAEELPENRRRFEEWYETQVKIVNFLQNFLTPIFTDFYATLIAGEMTWQEFGDRAVDAIKRILIELLALATVAAILEAMGLGGVVKVLGSLGGLFQTPSGDWWAQKEGYDMAKFFGIGFQQSLSRMVGSAVPKTEPIMLLIEAEPGIIVKKMAGMSLGYKRKFHKTVIKAVENRE